MDGCRGIEGIDIIDLIEGIDMIEGVWLAGVLVFVVGVVVGGVGVCIPVDGDGGVAVVEGDAFAGADDEGELGEGCEGEEFADGGEDRGVDNAGGRDDKA